MSNSSLATYTKLSPNCTKPRNRAIDTVTVHCTAGNKDNTAKQIANISTFTEYSTDNASCNYAVGGDGSCALIVDEANRSWCSSSPTNDHRAITIEVASNISGSEVNLAAYATLIKLLADICYRNNISKLIWSNNKSTRVKHSNGCNMTVHRDYANKSCPGEWLYSRMGQIATDVNNLLGSSTNTTVTSNDVVRAGDIVKIASAATYYNGKAVPTRVKNKQWIISSVSGDRAILGASTDGQNNICSPINTSFLTVVASDTFSVYKVKVTADELNIRSGPSTSYAAVGSIKDKGIYTIVDECAGWGKLKSGAGWISLSYTVKK